MIAQLQIPIWGEARVGLEHAALRFHPVFRGDGVARGDGAPVLLVPGFLAGDVSLGVMAAWLKRIGYQPCRAGIRANVDCTSRALERLDLQLEGFAERHGRRVTIVGQSRGAGQNGGALFGYEQPLGGGLSLMADWNTGRNRFGYAAAGFGLTLSKRSYLSSGYYFGNEGRGNNFLGVYYGLSF